jgi:hypothetical protein
MFEEKLSIIPGFSAPKKPARALVLREPRKRFEKTGENAGHEHTVRMRAIKHTLRLTTGQLVSELNDYEREHQSHNFHKRGTMPGVKGPLPKGADKNRIDPNTPAWLPMTTVLMSSYLQGHVVQESYMALMRSRLENLFEFKKANGQLAPKSDIRTIMNQWYATLGIDPEDTSTSPTRSLARMIAPYYKRPVLAPVSGKLHIGKAVNGQHPIRITDAEGVAHEFSLNASDPINVKSGAQVKAGATLQHSVLMASQKRDGETILTQVPSIDHTTFFRWYSFNKMPRSVVTIELVQAAVEAAAKAAAEQR